MGVAPLHPAIDQDDGRGNGDGEEEREDHEGEQEDVHGVLELGHPRGPTARSVPDTFRVGGACYRHAADQRQNGHGWVTGRHAIIAAGSPRLQPTAVVGCALSLVMGQRGRVLHEESAMTNQRTIIYAVGAVIVIILLIIFATN